MRQILLACQGMRVCVSVDVYVTPCAVIKGFEEAIPEGLGQAVTDKVKPNYMQN